MQNIYLQSNRTHGPIFFGRVILGDAGALVSWAARAVRTVALKIFSSPFFPNLFSSRNFFFTLSRVEPPNQGRHSREERMIVEAVLQTFGQTDYLEILLRGSDEQRDAVIEGTMAAFHLLVQKIAGYQAHELTLIQNQGTHFIKTYLLKDISKGTKKAFVTLDPDSIHFFMFLTLFFYTVGPLKTEPPPCFFTQKTKEKIEQLRKELSPTDPSIPQTILTDFKAFNRVGASKNRNTTFKELRKCSFEMMLGEQVDLFMKCWKSALASPV